MTVDFPTEIDPVAEAALPMPFSGDNLPPIAKIEDYARRPILKLERNEVRALQYVLDFLKAHLAPRSRDTLLDAAYVTLMTSLWMLFFDDDGNPIPGAKEKWLSPPR